MTVNPPPPSKLLRLLADMPHSHPVDRGQTVAWEVFEMFCAAYPELDALVRPDFYAFMKDWLDIRLDKQNVGGIAPDWDEMARKATICAGCSLISSESGGGQSAIRDARDFIANHTGRRRQSIVYISRDWVREMARPAKTDRIQIDAAKLVKIMTEVLNNFDGDTRQNFISGWSQVSDTTP